MIADMRLWRVMGYVPAGGFGGDSRGGRRVRVSSATVLKGTWCALLYVAEAGAGVLIAGSGAYICEARVFECSRILARQHACATVASGGRPAAASRVARFSRSGRDR